MEGLSEFKEIDESEKIDECNEFVRCFTCPRCKRRVLVKEMYESFGTCEDCGHEIEEYGE